MRGSPPNCISESGLYRLIMRSDKPEAREFQDWVTRIVLPPICRDGGYILGEEKVRLPAFFVAIPEVQIVEHLVSGLQHRSLD
ncbi:prophage antirepressor-like protein [Sinorhizobium fredii]